MPSLDGIRKAAPGRVPTPSVRHPRSRRPVAPRASSNTPHRVRAMRLAVGTVMLVLIAVWVALLGRSGTRTSSSVESVNPFRAFAEKLGALFGGTTQPAPQTAANEEHLRELRASVFPEFERIMPK